MADHSFILNLRSVPEVKTVRRIPGIEVSRSTKQGTLYIVKYFLDAGHGAIMVRFTSDNKSFKQLHTFDICNKKLKPTIGIGISETAEQDVILKMVGDIISLIKNPLHIKESYNRTVKTTIQEALNEMGIGDVIAPILKNKKIMAWIKLIGLVTGIKFGLEVILSYRYVIRKLVNWFGERYVAGPLERKINERLFSGQKGDESAFARYQTLITYVKHVTKGRGNALIICGPPGMSKTYIVKRTLHFQKLRPRIDYVVEKGSTLSLADTYSLLFVNRKKILVLDDFDKPLQDPDMINFLKSLTDTYEKRILSLPREQLLDVSIKGTAAPQKFEFKGKIILVTNLRRDDIDKALLSRAPAIEVNFNSKEILKALSELIVYINPDVSTDIKLEVYQYICELYRKDPHITIDFRVFVTSVDARVGNPEGWKEMVKVIVNFRK